MIAHLSGNVLDKAEKWIVLDVNGVGYKVSVPITVLETAELQFPLKLHIHTVVREDDISLYGFQDKEHLKLFEQLISINGIGARLAMDCFASPFESLKNAIAMGDIARLTQIPGIGKKTAERIILELKDKVEPTGTEANAPIAPSTPEIQEEVLHALLSLGYHRGDIRRVLSRIDEPVKNSEEIIKYFLKHI